MGNRLREKRGEMKRNERRWETRGGGGLREEKRRK